MASHRSSRRRVIEEIDEDDIPTASTSRNIKRPRASSVTSANGHAANSHASSSRARTNGNRVAVEASDSESEDEEGQDQGDAEEDDTPVPEFRPELERDVDGYAAGSIVRIKLRNFMSYEFVEFRPGPDLNMILGPNGTGKSTIAAAIAIGLGFEPSVMGRAPDLKDYIKQGCETAQTEVEIKGRRGKRNQIIWRRFSRDQSRMEWKLDGAASTKPKVKACVASYGAQAGNPCCFLPQDKVSDFAKMDPVKVLEETMKAAGNPKLSEWHQKLVEKGTTVKDDDAMLAEATRERDTLQHEVDQLAPDVRHFENRQQLEAERDELRARIPGTAFRIQSAKHKELKAEMRRVNDQVKELEDQQQPLKDLLDQQVQKCARKTDHVKDVEGDLFSADRTINSLRDKLNRAEREGEAIQDKYRQIRDDEKRRQKNIAATEASIAQQEKIAAGPRVDTHGAIREKKEEIKQVTSELRPREAQLEQHEATVRRHQQDVKQIHFEIEQANQALTAASSIEARRKAALFKENPSLEYAAQWIEQNRGQLGGKVFLPAFISANVTDPRYAWQIEWAMGNAGKNTIVCENQNDYRKLLALNGHNYKNRKVKLSLATINVTENSLNPQRPVQNEQLPELGFDGYAIDFINADKTLLAYLCDSANLHRCALTQRSGGDINADRVARAGIVKWATATEITTAKRSAYGRREFQMASSAPTTARFLNVSADNERIKHLQETVAGLKRSCQEKEKPILAAKEAEVSCRAEVKALSKDLDRLDAEIKTLQEEGNKQNIAHRKLQQLKQRLEDLQNEPSVAEKRDKLKVKARQEAVSRVQILQQYHDASDAVTDLAWRVAEAHVAVGQAQANADAVRDALGMRQRDLNDKRDDVAELIAKTSAAKEKSDALKDRFIELYKTLPKEAQQRLIKDAERIPLEETRARLQEVDTELSLAIGVSPATIERYNRLSESLAHKVDEVQKRQAALATLQGQVDQLLAHFNPELDSLVAATSEKFSAFFQDIGCAGAVQVKRVEGDYAQWGIEILVSYRDSELMSVLTMNRQSGGERSLATVTYLMSLSAMARTPFSLVDEINQGMDQSYERTVHNQLVNVTCSDVCGQYFLITPKLLTNLKYHPKMTVLTVMHGPGVPDSSTPGAKKLFGSLGNSLAKYAASRGISLAAA